MSKGKSWINVKKVTLDSTRKDGRGYPMVLTVNAQCYDAGLDKQFGISEDFRSFFSFAEKLLRPEYQSLMYHLIQGRGKNGAQVIYEMDGKIIPNPWGASNANMESEAE
jgi:hypothetical protein